MKVPQDIPRATYRLQLHRDFKFVQATAIVPYLSALGISHCYISPCLKARPGSMHGYDIVDHNSLNPEIGSPEEFDQFVNTLHQHGMGLILDIVPNHMAIMGSDNAWWLDVLENGQSSAHASFFDIDWRPLKEELHGKVLVPVLHDHYGAVLESGELKLVFLGNSGEFDVAYRGHRFPVGPREYPRMLQRCIGTLTSQLGDQNPDLLELQSIITAFTHLPGRHETDPQLLAERARDKEIHKRRLATVCARSPQIVSVIKETVTAMNGNPSDPASFEDLHELIKAQTFRLANWRVASDDINYRRFFDTNDLAGIRMENEEVFQATHRLILGFIAEGKVDGLRLDHPDGLYDPAQYFERLQRGIMETTRSSGVTESGSRYVIIEKILTGAERLPMEWPVCGTSGYDFANLVNGLFVDAGAAKSFDRIYQNVVDEETDFDDLAYHCRKLIIRVALVSELNVLANQLARIALSKRRTCDFTLNSLRDSLMEVVANFPVYRTYVSPSGTSDHDARYIGQAIVSAKRRSPAGDTSIFDFIREVLLVRITDGQDSAYRKAVFAFVMKFQQFTSPVMAKGLEDTAFYRYNRLVSLNDVGGDLHRFGISVAEFHAANQQRLRDWPHTMLATSTHDSKRTEDVRARIDVLSEIPSLWRLRVRDWRKVNLSRKTTVSDKPAPSPDDEYLLYQTLLGAWPNEPLTDEKGWKTFRERIEAYMLKAIREAKQNTSWINRNSEYEAAVASFVNTLLHPTEGEKFLKDFLPFQQRVAHLGIWNSLSQTLLKLTCPGVPDIYQGNDLFDFSLVDPDNRRPVDFARREQVFGGMRKLDESGENVAGRLVNDMLGHPENGELKLYATWKILSLRKQYPEIFRNGDYVPLAVEGTHADHVVAFLRKSENANLLVVAPRLVARLLGDSPHAPMGKDAWQDTHILLPSCPCSKSYRNSFTGEILEMSKVSPQAKQTYVPVGLSRLLQSFPLGLYLQSSIGSS